MNRKERRAAAHAARKLARKAGFPNHATESTTPAAAPSPVPEPTVAATPTTPDTEAAKPEPRSSEPISDAKLAANRANAQHSSGPRTEIGRSVSSQNRLTHGLARHNGAFKLLPSEDANGFEALKANLVAEHKPTTETESILIATMVESHWLANRAANLQARCFNEETGEIADAKMFSLYLRYQTTHTRAFHKSLNDLAKLRAEKRKAYLGFEAHKRKNEEIRLKNERHAMKKEAHPWSVLLKTAQTTAKLSQTLSQVQDAELASPGFEAKFEAELAKHGIRTVSNQGGTAAAAA